MEDVTKKQASAKQHRCHCFEGGSYFSWTWSSANESDMSERTRPDSSTTVLKIYKTLPLLVCVVKLQRDNITVSNIFPDSFTAPLGEQCALCQLRIALMQLVISFSRAILCIFSLFGCESYRKEADNDASSPLSASSQLHSGFKIPEISVSSFVCPDWATCVLSFLQNIPLQLLYSSNGNILVQLLQSVPTGCRPH